MNDPVHLLRAATDTIRPVLTRLTTNDLARPTPCTEWNVGRLLGHIAGRAVITTQTGQGASLTTFPDETTLVDHDQPGTALQQLLDRAVSTWQGRDMTAIVTTPLGEMPAAGLLTFAAQDIFVHTWDLAHALELAPLFDPAHVTAFDATLHATITDDVRAMFMAPAIDIATDAPAIDRLVAFTGRQP
jgi:uncharacterized protein (TIGR03086 family)